MSRPAQVRQAIAESREMGLGPTLLRYRLLPVAAAFAATIVFWGVPLERERILVWIIIAVAVQGIGSGTSRLWAAIRDWLPFAVALTAYDYTRGAADTLGMPVQLRLPAVADRALFAGAVPTVWLQERLAWSTTTYWWESIIAAVYLSHFFVPYAIAAWLWWKYRDRWLAFIRRYFVLTAMGLATYILVPGVPPWLASELGEIGPVSRTSVRGFDLIGLSIAEKIVDKGQAAVNHVAALPSLHMAYPVLIALFFWPTASRPARVLLAAYPILMGFTLVITGEHYVFDLILGALYAAGAMAICSRWESTRRRKRAAEEEALEPAQSAAVAVSSTS